MMSETTLKRDIFFIVGTECQNRFHLNIYYGIMGDQVIDSYLFSGI